MTLYYWHTFKTNHENNNGLGMTVKKPKFVFSDTIHINVIITIK